MYVIDGEYLLRRVTWQINQSFVSICDSYMVFDKSNSAVIIFNGYRANIAELNIGFAKHDRRSRKMVSNYVVFNNTMVLTVIEK